MPRFYLLMIVLILSLSLRAQSLYFPPNGGTTWDTLSPASQGYCSPRVDSLYNFLAAQNTKAFILLQDGKIVLEKYFGTHTATTPWQWASAGKTITAFMTGMAQQEGFLSIADTTSTYLGQGWTDCTPAREANITIRHQLCMTTGLDDGVTDPFCTLDTCLVYKADPDTRWAYHNGPYTLLDGVIESATGQSLNTYTTQKLKTPTGMTGTFVSVDYNNVFFSNARSMARFGLLMLNKGNWNGNQIMTDTAYFNQLANTSQSINLSYGYLWWLNGKQSHRLPGPQIAFPGSICPKAPADTYMAMGKDGQFLNVTPSRNMVWMRMGDAPDNLPVPYLLNDQIWDYINRLTCTPTDLAQNEVLSGGVQLFPNPAQDIVRIKAEKLISKVELFNAQGQLITTERPTTNEMELSIQDLPRGFYFVHLSFIDGKTAIGKLVVGN